jgi:hypothetical protein
MGDSATHHQDQLITPVSLSTKGETRNSKFSQPWNPFQYRSPADSGGVNLMKNT